MHISAITLKHFRCFSAKTIIFNKPLSLIEGPNGSGKTTLLEALYYACYLRSFRTRTPRELIGVHSKAFSLKLKLDSPEPTTITAGYTPNKRSVKVNDCSITSYKQLIDHYRVISITDEDIALVKGSPESRRTFIDQAAVLIKPDYSTTLRTYSHVLEQRNALLAQLNNRSNQDSLRVWTEQFDTLIKTIRATRTEIITILEERLNTFLTTFFTVPFSVQITYTPRLTSLPLLNQELYARHTLYGAHLDECSIHVTTSTNNGAARIFASRGQQRLIALLLKIAQPALLNAHNCIFLLDDVVSDLDQATLTQFLNLIMSFKTQVILTSPLEHPLLHAICSSYDYERIAL